MPFFAHADVLDNGLLYIQNNCDLVALIHAYAFGDSYATVTSRIIASYAANSGSFVISSLGNNRRISSSDVVATATASTPGTYSLHVAYLDSANSKVLWVTECAVNKDVVAGNSVVIPSSVYVSNQPVAGI